jgi:hypothetical protein
VYLHFAVTIVNARRVPPPKSGPREHIVVARGAWVC